VPVLGGDVSEYSRISGTVRIPIWTMFPLLKTVPDQVEVLIFFVSWEIRSAILFCNLHGGSGNSLWFHD